MIWASDCPMTLLWSYVVLSLNVQPVTVGEAAIAADGTAGQPQHAGHRDTAGVDLRLPFARSRGQHRGQHRSCFAALGVTAVSPNHAVSAWPLTRKLPGLDSN